MCKNKFEQKLFIHNEQKCSFEHSHLSYFPSLDGFIQWIMHLEKYL